MTHYLCCLVGCGDHSAEPQGDGQPVAEQLWRHSYLLPSSRRERSKWWASTLKQEREREGGISRCKTQGLRVSSTHVRILVSLYQW